MGKSNQGIHGGFTGRVGNIVGSQLRGKQVLRIRPASVANPNTEKQRNQRERFGLVNRFLATQSQLVKIGFRSYSGRQSAFNAAASYNLRNAITGDYPDVQLNYTDLRISMGQLPGLKSLTAAFEAPDKLRLEWADNSSQQLASADDMLMVGLYETGGNGGITYVNAAARAATMVTLELPDALVGKTVAVFAFFTALSALGTASTRDQLSDSVFGGLVDLA